MWPSNDQDTGDIDPGKKFIINLKENHELWDRDGLVNHQKIVVSFFSINVENLVT